MSERKHIPALDGIRGLAVVVVFLFHYGGGAKSHNLVIYAFGSAVRLGWGGVSLFFALSGFLITRILWQSRGSAKWWLRFYQRRALRIFPLYYFAVLLFAIAAHWAGNVVPTAKGVGAYALYLQNEHFAVATQQVNSRLDLFHFWSLAVEEQFYLVWPFLIHGVRDRKAGMRLCVGAILLSLVFRLGLARFGWMGLLPGGSTLSRCGELAVGAWLALAYEERGRTWNRVSACAPWVALASFAGVLGVGWMDRDLLLQGRMMTAGLFLAALFSGALLSMALDGGGICHMLENRVLRWLGGISYGLYVYSVLFGRYYERAADWMLPGASVATNSVLRMVIAIPCTLAISYASFRWFESPILRLNRRSRRGEELVPGAAIPQRRPSLFRAAGRG